MQHIFVLSGGSIRGAWQTGALLATLERLPPTDHVAGIFGVSVGALNAAYLSSNTTYTAGAQTTIDDLRRTCVNLKTFWQTKVTGPGSLVTPRTPAELLQGAFAEGPQLLVPGAGWRGLADHAPLVRLFKPIVNHATIAKAPYPVRVGYTDYVAGKYYSKDLRTDVNSNLGVERLVFASAVTPLIMDYIGIQKPSGDWARLSDGGLRHVVPTKEVVTLVQQLITSGTRSADLCVHVYVCSPSTLSEWYIGTERVGAKPQRPGLLDIIDRAFAMMTQTVIDGDLYEISNEVTQRGSSILLYRNPTEYLTNSIVSFTANDISSMLASGHAHATPVIDNFIT